MGPSNVSTSKLMNLYFEVTSSHFEVTSYKNSEHSLTDVALHPSVVKFRGNFLVRHPSRIKSKHGFSSHAPRKAAILVLCSLGYITVLSRFARFSSFWISFLIGLCFAYSWVLCLFFLVYFFLVSLVCNWYYHKPFKMSSGRLERWLST